MKPRFFSIAVLEVVAVIVTICGLYSILLVRLHIDSLKLQPFGAMDYAILLAPVIIIGLGWIANLYARRMRIARK